MPYHIPTRSGDKVCSALLMVVSEMSMPVNCVMPIIVDGGGTVIQAMKSRGFGNAPWRNAVARLWQRANGRGNSMAFATSITVVGNDTVPRSFFSDDTDMRLGSGIRFTKRGQVSGKGVCHQSRQDGRIMAGVALPFATVGLIVSMLSPKIWVSVPPLVIQSVVSTMMAPIRRIIADGKHRANKLATVAAPPSLRTCFERQYAC